MMVDKVTITINDTRPEPIEDPKGTVRAVLAYRVKYVDGRLTELVFGPGTPKSMRPSLTAQIPKKI